LDGPPYRWETLSRAQVAAQCPLTPRVSFLSAVTRPSVPLAAGSEHSTILKVTVYKAQESNKYSQEFDKPSQESDKNIAANQLMYRVLSLKYQHSRILKKHSFLIYKEI
jgi:hypothetical protein